MSVCLLVSLFFPTPDPVEWNRCIFIGTNQDAFFVYLARQSASDSYYVSVDSVFLCKISKATNELMDRVFLREIVLEESNESRNPILVRKTFSHFDVEQYLNDNDVRTCFSSDDLHTLANQDGVFLSDGQQSINLISIDRLYASERWLFGSDLIALLEQSDYLKWLNRTLKVVDVYRDDADYYLLLQNGKRDFEAGFHQFVVRIPDSEVRDTMNTLTKK